MPRKQSKIYDPLNDVNGDSGFLYQKVGSCVNAEEYKSMLSAAESMPKEGFAWAERRMFPIFDEKTASLSSWYVAQQDGAIPDHVKAKIAEALEFYDVEVVHPTEKVASIDVDAWLFPEHKKVLVETPQQLKEAEALLREWAYELPITTRTYGFRRLRVKAASMGVELDKETLPYAGDSRCKVATLLSEISKRRDHVPHGEIKIAFGHLERQLRELNLSFIDDALECDKLASLLHSLDSDAGITYKYNRRGALGFSDPILAVFNTTKTANDYVTMAGNEVPIEDIANLDPEMVASIVGKEFLEDVVDDSGRVNPSEMAAMINIMPADLQEDIYNRLLT